MNPSPKEIPAIEPYVTVEFGGKKVEWHKSKKIAYKTKCEEEEGVALKVGEFVIESPQAGISHEERLDNIRKLDNTFAATHTFTVGEEQNERIPNGQIYIECKEAHQYDQLANLYVLNFVKDAARGKVYKVEEGVTPLNPVKLMAELQRMDFVITAEADSDTLVSKNALNLEAEYIKHQWSMDNTGEGQGDFARFKRFVKGADCNGLKALKYIEENNIPIDRTVAVGIIDDALQTDHPSFVDENGTSRITRTYSANARRRNDTENVSPENTNDKHGTSVTGIAAGAGKMLGVNPYAQIEFVQNYVLSDDNIEEQFGFIEQSANVAAVCCSWGAFDPHYTLSTRQKAAMDSCRINGRGGKGIVIVFANGNGSQQFVKGFAAHSSNIGIASSGSMDEHSTYSNAGDTTFACAPSSVMPVVSANVAGHEESVARGYEAILSSEDTEYTGQFGGTSAAAPKVAGAISLWAAINPELTATELIDILRKSSKPMTTTGEWSPEFGYGKLDVYAGVLLTLQTLDIGIEPVMPTHTIKLSRYSFTLKAFANGQINNISEAALHTLNIYGGGAYVSVSKRTTTNNDSGQPDFDIYIKRIGDTGMSRTEVEGAIKEGNVPHPENYEYAGTSKLHYESLRIEAFEPGTYGILVVSKGWTGGYTLRLYQQ